MHISTQLPFLLPTLLLLACAPKQQGVPEPLPQPAPPQTPTVEPYLQNPGTTEMTVVWWTQQSEPASFVELTPTTPDAEPVRVEASDEYEPSMELWRHQATLTGLEAATRYDYVAGSETSRSRAYQLRTAPDEPVDQLRFAFLGDGRSDGERVLGSHRAVMHLAEGSDLVFELGDSVYQGNREHWLRYLQQVLTSSGPELDGPSTGSRVPVHHMLGNHEIALVPTGEEEVLDEDVYASSAETVPRFRSLFVHPPNGSSVPAFEERYYTLDYGPATFIVLDGNNTSDDALDNHDFLPDQSSPDWEPGSEQHSWLVEQLVRAQARSAFTFVLSHPSPWSCGVHGAPDPAIDGQRGHQLRALTPILLEHGVDAFISSHDHLAEAGLVGPEGFEQAMDPQDPANMLFFVMGDSGASSRGCQEGWEQWMSVKGDGSGPYFQTWLYSWIGDEALHSLLDLQLERLDEGRWQARFAVLRTDGERFAETVIERESPRP